MDSEPTLRRYISENPGMQVDDADPRKLSMIAAGTAAVYMDVEEPGIREVVQGFIEASRAAESLADSTDEIRRYLEQHFFVRFGPSDRSRELHDCIREFYLSQGYEIDESDLVRTHVGMFMDTANDCRGFGMKVTKPLFNSDKEIICAVQERPRGYSALVSVLDLARMEDDADSS